MNAPQVYNEGEGEAAFKIEIGHEQIESSEVLALTATPLPVTEVKPLDPDHTVITATQSHVEATVVTEVTPPTPVAPQEVAVRDQVAQLDTRFEKASPLTIDGGKTSALNGYIGKIHNALQKVRLERRVKASGQVIVGFTVDLEGKVKSQEVIKSSGVASIDKAAIEMIGKASFPPPPDALGGDEVYEVPLTFIAKSS